MDTLKARKSLMRALVIALLLSSSAPDVRAASPESGKKAMQAVTVDQLIAKVQSYESSKKKQEYLAQLLAGVPSVEYPSLITRLRACLRSAEWEQQANAVFVLGLLGPAAKDAVPDMIEAMKARMANVSWEVSAALPKIGNAAVPPLISALRRCNEKSREVYRLNEAIAALGPVALDAAPVVVPFLREGSNNNSTEALVSIGPASIPFVCAGLANEKLNITYGAAQVLSKFGDRSTDQLLKALRRASPAARKNITNVLSRMNPPPGKSVAPAMCHLLTDSDRQVVTCARDILLKVGPVATLDVCELLSLNSSNGFDEATDILQQFGPSATAALPALRRMLSSSQYDKGCRAASTILKIRANDRLALDKLLEYGRSVDDL